MGSRQPFDETHNERLDTASSGAEVIGDTENARFAI